MLTKMQLMCIWMYGGFRMFVIRGDYGNNQIHHIKGRFICSIDSSPLTLYIIPKLHGSVCHTVVDICNLNIGVSLLLRFATSLDLQESIKRSCNLRGSQSRYRRGRALEEERMRDTGLGKAWFPPLWCSKHLFACATPWGTNLSISNSKNQPCEVGRC